MHMKINNRGKITISIIALILVLGIGIGTFWFLNQSKLVFVNSEPTIQINGDFDAIKNIEKVKGGKVADVKVDISKIKKDTLGNYPVKYTYQGETREIDVTVVDQKAPTFDVNELEIDLGMKVDPSTMVSNINDDTKTKVTFKEEYKFDAVKDVKVVLVVTDQANNKTQKDALVHVLSKDSEAPVLNGVAERVVVKGNPNVNLLLGISASDNRDPKAKIEVDKKNLDINKIGDYTIKYLAKDRSGNTAEKTCVVKVVEKTEIGVSTQTNEKVVYLTFDDGPSINTIAVLDILDKYNIKATFFVTGLNPDYFYLIKEASKRGHTIGLHTYSHNYSQVYSSIEAYYEDLNKIGNICNQQLGFVPKYIRFPGGSSNNISKKFNSGIMSNLTEDVLSKGYQYYDWNGDTQDGSGKLSANELVKNATIGDSNNIIILAHDAKGKQTTIEALPRIIEYYKAKGYSFAKIDDYSYVPHHHVNN